MVMTVSLPDPLASLLKEYKKITGLKKADIVRRALEFYIRNNPPLIPPVEPQIGKEF